MKLILRFCLLLLLIWTSSCSQTKHREVDSPVFHPKKRISKLNPPIIVIDPGHGGQDTGAHSQENQYQEKHLTLATAMMLKKHLEYFGYRVVMTRKRDVYIQLNKRAQIANHRRNSLFISLHFNSAPNRKAQGIEIFYYAPNYNHNKNRAQHSKDFAQSVLSETIRYTKAPSRGIKCGNFLVIRKTEIPAILLEGGFLTNKEELRKLKNPKYLNRLAWGVARGVEHYFNSEI